MFQRLRILPQFTATSDADKVILGAILLAPDDVTVELGPGNEGAFAVNIQFHKCIVHEFVLQPLPFRHLILIFILTDRIWKFSIMITSESASYGPLPGSWCVLPSLKEFNPLMWFDGSWMPYLTRLR